jgi:hypothetical protein
MFISEGVATAYTEASLIAAPFFKRQGFQSSRFEEITVTGTVLQRWLMYKTLSEEGE